MRPADGSAELVLFFIRYTGQVIGGTAHHEQGQPAQIVDLRAE
jgi:hypothetical protein